jgi:hypothetical protein
MVTGVKPWGLVRAKNRLRAQRLAPSAACVVPRAENQVAACRTRHSALAASTRGSSRDVVPGGKIWFAARCAGAQRPARSTPHFAPGSKCEERGTRAEHLAKEQMHQRCKGTFKNRAITPTYPLESKPREVLRFQLD